MDVETAMDKARTKVQAAVAKWVKESREKEEELMEKEMISLVKKKRDAAVAEATKQRDLLVQSTKRTKEFCATFESGETKLEKLVENLKALQTEVNNLHALIATGKKAQDYSRDAKKLNDSATNLERLFNDLEKSGSTWPGRQARGRAGATSRFPKRKRASRASPSSTRPSPKGRSRRGRPAAPRQKQNA